MNVIEEQRALAFLHAAIIEDQDVLEYLSKLPVSAETFWELLRIAAGALDHFHGQDRAAEIVQGWMQLSDERAG